MTEHTDLDTDPGYCSTCGMTNPGHTRSCATRKEAKP